MGERGSDTGPIDGGSAGTAGDDPSVSRAVEATLHADGVSFGGGDAALLRAIDDAGSLNRAADALDRSYSRAHKRLQALEGAFGPLVESRRGGAGGGGSALTEGARRLLATFARLRTESSGLAGVAETVLEGRVVDRDGELALVETAAGRVRARATRDATAVSVTVRSDTVTLHDPDAAPAPAETSARNRFRGTVVDLDERDAIVRVSIDVGADRPLDALITAESVRELDLGRGATVVASFKTTATRASSRE